MPYFQGIRIAESGAERRDTGVGSDARDGALACLRRAPLCPGAAAMIRLSRA